MRLFLILGSIFFIFMFVNGLIQTQKEIDVFNKGELVKMRIDEIPGSCLGTKNKYHMKVSFEGKNFLKRISGDFCENHNIGDVLELKYLSGSDITLFPNENPNTGYYSVVFFGIFGFGILIWFGILNKPLFIAKSKYK